MAAASASPASASPTHSATAKPTPTAPCASGRERFAGCRRSASRSSMSLTTYTAHDTRQNAVNSASNSATRLASPQPWPKTRPRKTNPFLIHWCGRIKRMSDLAKESVLCRAGQSAEITLAEIATPLRKVPGHGVETLAHRLQHPLSIFGEIESAAQRDMKGRTRNRELPVFDGAEVGAIVGIAGKNILVLRKDPPGHADYRPYFRSVEYREFAVSGATFHLALGRGFDFAEYRERVLKPVRERFYAIPRYLPQGRCYFCERYFGALTCPAKD